MTLLYDGVEPMQYVGTYALFLNRTCVIALIVLCGLLSLRLSARMTNKVLLDLCLDMAYRLVGRAIPNVTHYRNDLCAT